MRNLARTIFITAGLSLPANEPEAFTTEAEMPAFVGCYKHDLPKIKETQQWLEENIGALFTEVEATCDEATSAPCPTHEELVVTQTHIKRLIRRAQILCRKADPKWVNTLEINAGVEHRLRQGGKNYGLVARFPNFETGDPGAYLLTRNVLNGNDPCVRAKAMAHELTHLGAIQLHDIENKDDWIFLTGQIAEEKCRAELNQEQPSK
jgi:hypothetical protein